MTHVAPDEIEPDGPHIAYGLSSLFYAAEIAKG
jgi:hypothetical protein